MSNRSELDKGEKGGRKNKVAKSKSSRNEVNECTENSGPVVVVTDESDPPNVSAINKTLPGRSCKSCRGPDAGGMVQCDECSKWHHFTCVGVTEDVENHSWSCPKCVSAKWVQRENSTSSKHLQPSDASQREPDQAVNPDHERDLARDGESDRVLQKVPSIVKSTSSKRSSRTLLKLQMEKLEEEHRLEREYLDRKYALLQEMASEDGSSYTSSVSSSMNRVRDWVKSNNQKEDDPINQVPFEPQRNSTHYLQSVRPENPDRLSAGIDQLSIGRTFSVGGGIPNHLHSAGPVTSVNFREDVQLQPKSTMRSSVPVVPSYYQQPSAPRYHPSAALLPGTSTQRGEFLREPTVVQHDHSRHVEDFDDPCPITAKQIAARQAISKELPAFSGKPDEWPIFFSAFSNTTAMCGFTDGENTTRLQKCLTGKAYDSVKSLLMHPSNVKRVIATLRMRFGQPEAIVQSLIERINTLPTLREDKLETIMDFAVEVQNFCSIVDACGLEEHMYNVAMLHQLVSKLPPSIKLDWARHRQMFSKINLATFGNWMYSLAEAASSVTIPGSSPGSQEPKTVRGEPRLQKKGSGFLNAHLETESTAARETSELQKNTKGGCLVCKACCDSVVDCKQFLELSRGSRWAVVREFGLCRRCLLKHNGSCDAKACGKDGCTFKHHALLHKEQSGKHETTPSESTGNPDSAHHGCNTHRSHSSSALFRYIPVIVYGEKSSVHTFAFLDDGSELTLLDNDLANELGLTGSEVPLNLRWTGGTERCEKESRITRLAITGVQDRAKQFTLDEVRTVKELQLPHQSLDMDEMKERYPHLRGLPIKSYERVRPRILIGMKHVHVSLVLQSREGKPEQPIATKTRLGWTVCGASYENRGSSMVHYTFHIGTTATSDEDLHQAMKEYFSLDSMGVVKSNQSLLSSEDQRAYSLLEARTIRKGNRYETGLLWRFDNSRLPNSRSMALHRHQLLEKRMQKDPQLAAALNQKIADYRQKGYIRKLQKDEEIQSLQRTWYLPVFPVVNPNKPGKIRIVWDAAATTYGVSLNSALLKGPDQLCSLFSILVQFRKHRIGITGDISEMFHQVQIREEDRPCQRFFWNEDGTTAVYEMCVMTFGACCSPSSAQYVKNLNAERFSGQYPEAVDTITKKHYVDDMLDSVESEEEAIQLAQDVKYVHSQGGFEIRNWISNSEKVMAVLGGSETSTKCLNLCAEMSMEKVLGLWWCTESDAFTYKVGWNRYDEALLGGQRRPTKREVLRVLMTIFDPLGLIAHFLIYLKVLLQEIWRSGIQWDDEIDDNLLEKWKLWLRVLPEVEKVQIPRCYRTQVNYECDVQLHTFVDASENSFAAVSFLRFASESRVECIIVASKTRVAPLKFQSIPRLELQAAVLGIRLAQSIAESLSIRFTKRCFWTDSQDVLCWINSDHRRYSQFVAHRVSEILDITESTDWFWVPTKLNVADDATKWSTQPDLSNESRWFKGPSFLCKSEEEWPAQPPRNNTTAAEVRANLVGHLSASRPLIVFENFSSWKRLARVVGFVQRFLNNCRQKKENLPCCDGVLSATEINDAEECILRLIQQETFADEISALKKQKAVPKTSTLVKLSPWLDDRGILRMLGRTSSCLFITKDAKNPIILPRDHHVTSLVISFYHNKFHHLNHETVVNELRQKYWIPRVRVCYSKVRKNCQRCKNERAIPHPPIMADLPPARLAAFTRPFTHVGIDYFGPIEVAIGRRVEKRWGMLATCMTTRAVHIEIAHSLSTSSCVMAIRNMIARRGIPRQIYCDRGTNFVGASRELARIAKDLNHEAIMSEIVSPDTQWSFNPPSSPHMGGSWERLIRSVKDNLASLNLPRKPSDEVLRNAFAEIENTLNARPLTHVAIEDHAAPALTPNHILLGSSSGTKPLTTLDDSSVAVRQCWRASQLIANQFWKRWLTDYLPEITRRTKWHSPCSRPLKVGDIVIITDPKLPRNCWPRGKIISTRPSKDGEVRSATVRTSSGVYERPVVKLAVLDIMREEE